MDAIKLKSEINIYKVNDYNRNMLSNQNLNTYRTISLPIKIDHNKLSTKTDKLLSHVLQLFQNINNKPNAKMKYNNILENISLSKEKCNLILEKDCIVYRCQLSSKKEVCCCSCNSDAMFEVMKSLYDCYKKKNCDNCKCVLCGRLPKDSRKFKDIEKKSQGDGIAVTTDKKLKPSKPKEPLEKEGKEKSRGKELITPSIGDTNTEKERKQRSPQQIYSPVEVEKVKKNARELGLITPSIGESPSQKVDIQKTRAKKAPSADKERVQKEAKSAGITIHKKKSDAYKMKPKEQPIKPTDTVSHPLTEKEQISKDARLLGLTTPSQGDTTSEKNKIRIQRSKKAPTEQQKKVRHRALTAGIIKPEPEVKQIMEKEAREAGLATPSIGKTPSVKEKIRRSRAAKFTDKEREDIRKAAQAAEIIKPVKTTPIEQENILKEARLAGVITPSEGDTKSQKEKIRKTRSKKKPLEQKEKIRQQLQAGDIIAPQQIKSDKKIKPDKKIKSEKKKKEKKVKSSKSLKVECICSEVMSSRKKEITEVDRIKHSMQMAKALSSSHKKPSVTKTASKKDKAREAKRLSEKERIRQTLQSAGIIAQLDKTTPAEREKIKKMARDVGILTPSIGKTPSEKERIQKTRSKKHSVPEKERIRQQAQAAGIIPIKKSASQEKKDLLKQIRKAGLSTPSEGNTPSVKENIRQSRVRNSSKSRNRKLLKHAQDLGIKLNEKPLTSHEKKKIQQEGRSAGLLTPSIGSTPSKKKIIRETRAKTISSADKEQVRKKLQKSDRDELLSKKKPKKQKKSKKSKEKKLSECECKISLTKPAKKQKQATKSKEAVMKKARNAGLLTPSTGSTVSEKDRIQKTRSAKVRKSEKKKIQKSLQDLGIRDIKKGPPLTKHQSIETQEDLSLKKKNKLDKKEIIDTSKKPGTKKEPTAQKSKDVEEQKTIIKEARNAGLLTPSIGKNESEKEEIRKSRSAKIKPSEKKRLEKALKDLGIREMKKESTSKEASTRREKLHKSSSTTLPRRSLALKRRKKQSKNEIIDEKAKKQDGGKSKKNKGGKPLKITCDRACGCDSRKIKFKHSYVKIKVTSPDISSLCPCPDDCLPSVKQTENNGIRVTVGTVLIFNKKSLNYEYHNENYESMESNSIKTLYFNDSLLKEGSSYSSNLSNAEVKDIDTLENYISYEKFRQHFISQYVVQQCSLSRRYGVIRSYNTNVKCRAIEAKAKYKSETHYNKHVNSTNFFFDTSDVSLCISSSKSSCSRFTKQSENSQFSLSDINYGSQELFEDNSSNNNHTQTSESFNKFDGLDIYNNTDCLLKKYVRQIIFPYILHKIKNLNLSSNLDCGSDSEEQSAIFIVMPENEVSSENNKPSGQNIKSNINTNIKYEQQYTQYLAKTTKNVHITGVDKEGRLIYNTIATDTAERPCSCLEANLLNDNENNILYGKSVRKFQKSTCQQCSKSHENLDKNVYNLSNGSFIKENIDKCKCLPNKNLQFNSNLPDKINKNDVIYSKVQYDYDSDATDNIYLQFEDDNYITKDIIEKSNNTDSVENILNENLKRIDSQDKVNGIKLTISGKGATSRGFLDIPCIEKICFNKTK